MAKVLVKYSHKFLKQYYRLSPKLQKQSQARLFLWLNEPCHPQLRLHMLTGRLSGYYSINITGDIRALYKKLDDAHVIFESIGTHSELYGK